MSAATNAYEQGVASGRARFLPGLRGHHGGHAYSASMATVMWHGGLDCATAGYLPENNQQGATDFFDGFLQGIKDRRDEPA